MQVGQTIERDTLLRALVDVQYARNDLAFTRGSFRVRGDTVEIIPAYEELAVRIEFFGDEIERLYYLHPLTGEQVQEVDELRIFPATHYVAGPGRMRHAIAAIEEELAERLAELERQGKLLEAQRLRMRTSYDVEMMRQVGFCSGIENYSRHIDGRPAGSAPATLIDYFPEDFLLVIDESHVTVPQIGAMHEGDASRKRTLVDHGFRLPSALDNRPLTWEEFAGRIGQTVYLSATPGPYELGRSHGEFVEQVIRPTGLVDPEVVVKPTRGQIDDLIGEIRARTERDERVLVTTLTKKMSEDLTDYLLELGRPGPVPALGGRHAAPGRTTARAAAGRVRRAGRHQPAAGGPRPAGGLAGRRSWTPTRRASCAPRRRSSRRSAAPRATSTARCTCTPTSITPSMARAIDETNRRREKQRGVQHGARHRPAAAAQEDQRHPGAGLRRGGGHGPGGRSGPGRRLGAQRLPRSQGGGRAGSRRLRKRRHLRRATTRRGWPAASSPTWCSSSRSR